MAINYRKTMLKKNHKDKKKLLCFKPVTTDGSMGEPVYKYLTNEKKKGVVFLYNSVMSEEEGKNIEELGIRYGKKGRSRISRVLRAVFFQSSLAKRNKRRILYEKVNKAPNYDSPRYPQVSLISTEEEEDENSVLTNSSSLFCPWHINSSNEQAHPFSSDGSSKPIYKDSNYNNAAQQVQQVKNHTRECYYRSNYNNINNRGLCLLLISLLVLVFWGRICAILCTSTCLLFATR